MSDAQNRAQPESGSPSRKMSPVHRRSLHIHIFLLGALIFFGTWAFARVAVCWGAYGWGGEIGCRSHFVSLVILFGAAWVFTRLVYELSELAIQEFEGKRFRRPRALLKGYRSLKRGEQVHSFFAAFFVLAFLLGFAYLVFLSSVMF